MAVQFIINTAEIRQTIRNRKNRQFLRRIIRQQCGQVLTKDIEQLIAIDPHIQVLVRCNMNRLQCSVDSVQWFVEAIKAKGDAEPMSLPTKSGEVKTIPSNWVRDVHLEAKQHGRIEDLLRKTIVEAWEARAWKQKIKREQDINQSWGWHNSYFEDCHSDADPGL